MTSRSDSRSNCPPLSIATSSSMLKSSAGRAAIGARAGQADTADGRAFHGNRPGVRESAPRLDRSSRVWFGRGVRITFMQYSGLVCPANRDDLKDRRSRRDDSASCRPECTQRLRSSTARVRFDRRPALQSFGPRDLFAHLHYDASLLGVLLQQLSGKARQMGLGGFPAVSLAEARDKAQSARQQLASGIDPIDQRAA